MFWFQRTSWKCCTHLAACSPSVKRLSPSLSFTGVNWLIFLPQSCLVSFYATLFLLLAPFLLGKASISTNALLSFLRTLFDLLILGLVGFLNLFLEPQWLNAQHLDLELFSLFHFRPSVICNFQHLDFYLDRIVQHLEFCLNIGVPIWCQDQGTHQLSQPEHQEHPSDFLAQTQTVIHGYMFHF